MGKKKKLGLRIMVLCLCIGYGAVSLLGSMCLNIMKTKLQDNAETTMTALAEEVAEVIRLGVEGEIGYLEGLSLSPIVFGSTMEIPEEMKELMETGVVIGNDNAMSSMDPESQKSQLRDIALARNVYDIGFVKNDGTGYNYEMSKINYSDKDFFKAALAGETYISDPFEDSDLYNDLIMVFAVPVHAQGDITNTSICGVLYEVVSGMYLSDISNNVHFGEAGYAYVVNSKGVNVASTDVERVKSYESPIVSFAGQKEFESLIAATEDMISNEKGFTEYTYKGEAKCIGYCSTTNNWRAVAILNKIELFRGYYWTMNATVFVAMVIVVLAFIIGALFTKRIVRPVKLLNSLNGSLAEGDLSVELSKEATKVQDEIGQMASATEIFVDKLKEVVGQTKISSTDIADVSKSLAEMVTQSFEACDSISKAVEDISQGSVSQAEEVDEVLRQVSVLGDAVETIRNDVHKMISLALEAEESENDSNKALNDLIESSERTTVAVNEISNQVSETNVAIEKISKAADLITAIASQTNLLSLNASIEAARAGDAGKGFAVVATEIQQLSVQSDDAASTIQNIIDELTTESKKTLKKMDEALELIKDQQDRLNKTRDESAEVNNNVERMEREAEAINESIEKCAEVKANVSDIVANLAAISQENAASAEETTASMQELNANMGIIANSAQSLHDISDKLTDEMEFWKI